MAGGPTTDPGPARVDLAGPQPIRTGEVANLALDLLGICGAGVDAQCRLQPRSLRSARLVLGGETTATARDERRGTFVGASELASHVANRQVEQIPQAQRRTLAFGQRGQSLADLAAEFDDVLVAQRWRGGLGERVSMSLLRSPMVDQSTLRHDIEPADADELIGFRSGRGDRLAEDVGGQVFSQPGTARSHP